MPGLRGHDDRLSEWKTHTKGCPSQQIYLPLSGYLLLRHHPCVFPSARSSLARITTCSEGFTLHLLWAFLVSHASLRLALIIVLRRQGPRNDVQRRSVGEDNRQQVCVTPSSRLWLACRLFVGRNSLLLIILADACNRLMPKTVIYWFISIKTLII